MEQTKLKKPSLQEMEEDPSTDSEDSNRSIVNFNEKKIAGVIKDLIRKTPIPGPGDEMYNEMYKILVTKFTKSFYDSHTDPLEAEVTARKLAAWVMKYDEKVKELMNTKETETSQGKKKTTDGGTKEPQVKLYHVSNHLNEAYWEKNGQVVELVDSEGSQIFVKGLADKENKTTLVKKVKNSDKGNEVSSWIVEMADREQLKDVDESVSSGSDWLNDSTSSSLRSPVTIDEWKTLADIRMGEASSWKSYVGLGNSVDDQRQKSPGNDFISGLQFKPTVTACHATRTLRRNNNAINKNRFATHINDRSKRTRPTNATIIKPRTTSPDQSRIKKKKLEKFATIQNQPSNIRESLEALISNLPYRPYCSR